MIHKKKENGETYATATTEGGISRGVEPRVRGSS